jgi:hypothetical protein
MGSPICNGVVGDQLARADDADPVGDAVYLTRDVRTTRTLSVRRLHRHDVQGGNRQEVGLIPAFMHQSEIFVDQGE